MALVSPRSADSFQSSHAPDLSPELNLARPLK